MTAVDTDPAVAEVQRLLGPDTSRYPGDEIDWAARSWRNCPVCGYARYGMPLTCSMPSCAAREIADEIDADRRAES